jgi:hypothetical protein
LKKRTNALVGFNPRLCILKNNLISTYLQVPNRDLSIFLELAKKLKLKSKTLSAEDLEEFGLTCAIDEGRKTPFVSKASIMEKLKK